MKFIDIVMASKLLLSISHNHKFHKYFLDTADRLFIALFLDVVKKAYIAKRAPQNAVNSARQRTLC